MKLYIADHKPALVSLIGGCTATAVPVAAHAQTVASNIDFWVHFASGIIGLFGTLLGACWYGYSLYKAWKGKSS